VASWGHVVFKSTPEKLADPRGHHREYWQSICHIRKSWRDANGCRQPTGYVARYTYTTGRKGNTAVCDRWLCEHHAKLFAAKYGLEILDAEPPRFHGVPKHAS